MTLKLYISTVSTFWY